MSSLSPPCSLVLSCVSFTATATTEVYTLSLHDALPILWQAGPLRATEEGFSVGGALALRTVLIGVLAIGFLSSTDGVALMHSLRENARLSPRVAYSVLAGYRMLQDMPREWAIIQHAHAVRAPLRADGRPPKGPRHLARVVFTLLVVTVRRGERMAQALESRGLGLTPRTTWRPVRVERADWWLAAGVLAAVAAVLTLTAAAGVLRGPGALT